MAGQAIFLNYRKEDSPDAVERIHDRLAQDFSPSAIFKDTAALQAGQNWEQVISKTLDDCRVVLAIVGPNWSSFLRDRNYSSTNRDFVRLELEWARRAGVQIVPVLVNGATLLQSDLPEALAFLTTLQAAEVRRHDFHNDMERLIETLKEEALKGLVDPRKSGSPASKLWHEIKESCDSIALRSFADSFPGTTESYWARQRAERVSDAVSALSLLIKEVHRRSVVVAPSTDADSIGETIQGFERHCETLRQAKLAGANMLAYEVSKAALNRLTLSVALSNAKHGVRCNAILPGLMNTPMAINTVSDVTGVDPEALRAKRHAQVPLNARMGDAWDTAHAALFLASDEAKFITGVLLPVDGGMSARVG